MSLLPQVEHSAWGGPVRWLLIGHCFTTGKREKVVGDGIHSGNVVGTGIVGYLTGKGCYDVEELVSAGGGMWSTMMVGRFVVVLDG